MEKVVKKFSSFEEEEESDHAYWFDKTPEERLRTLQILRKQINVLKPEYGKSGARLQRVYRIVKQTQG